jgi:hypothetical protein
VSAESKSTHDRGCLQAGSEQERVHARSPQGPQSSHDVTMLPKLPLFPAT